MKSEFNRSTDETERRSVRIFVSLFLMSVVFTNAWARAAYFPGQEKSTNNSQQTANEEKEQPTMVSGIVIDEKGLPVKGQALELYMVVNGIARDAYGAPLRGAVTIGPNRQILGLMMFPVKSETDTKGQFSMKLPKYVMVPGGIEMTAWTIVALDTSGKAAMLTSKGEMITINSKPEAPKIDLGKLTVSPQATTEK